MTQEQQFKIGKVYENHWCDSLLLAVGKNSKGETQFVESPAESVPSTYTDAWLLSTHEAPLKESIAYLKEGQKEVQQRIQELEKLRQIMKSSLEKLRDLQDEISIDN